MAHVDLRQLPREQIKLLKPRRDLASVFDEFRIDDARFLEECEGRSRCCKCGQSRKYFCYTCCLPLERFRDRVPKVQLPFAVDIVKDAREIAGKSTAVHAPILAPGHVKLYTYPDIPEYSDASERVVLIFPGRGSLPLSALLPKTSTSSRSDSSLPFDRAVLVDCTWNQVKTILRDPRIAGLKRVELSQHETLFWRYQTGKPNTYLATIEALYYFTLDVHKFLEHRTSSSNKDDMDQHTKQRSMCHEIETEVLIDSRPANSEKLELKKISSSQKLEDQRSSTCDNKAIFTRAENELSASSALPASTEYLASIINEGAESPSNKFSDYNVQSSDLLNLSEQQFTSTTEHASVVTPLNEIRISSEVKTASASESQYVSACKAALVEESTSKCFGKYSTNSTDDWSINVAHVPHTSRNSTKIPKRNVKNYLKVTEAPGSECCEDLKIESIRRSRTDEAENTVHTGDGGNAMSRHDNSLGAIKSPPVISDTSVGITHASTVEISDCGYCEGRAGFFFKENSAQKHLEGVKTADDDNETDEIKIAYAGKAVPIRRPSDDQQDSVEERMTNDDKAMVAGQPSEQLFIDECCHQFDNLLFYFKFMFDKIHNLYGAETLRAYK